MATSNPVLSVRVDPTLHKLIDTLYEAVRPYGMKSRSQLVVWLLQWSLGGGAGGHDALRELMDRAPFNEAQRASVRTLQRRMLATTRGGF